jgi:glycosidase
MRAHADAVVHRAARGFTKSDEPEVPVISGGPFGYEHVNAAQQRREPNSMLNWTERIIRMRKEVPEIGWGDFQIIRIADPAILILRYDWRNNSVLIVHNLAAVPKEIRFDPACRATRVTRSSTSSPRITATPARMASIAC